MSVAEVDLRDKLLRLWGQAPPTANSAATSADHFGDSFSAETNWVHRNPSNLSLVESYRDAMVRRDREVHHGRYVVYVTTRLVDRRDPFKELLDAKIEAARQCTDRWLRSPKGNAVIGQRVHELIESAREEYPETEIPSQHVLDTAFRFFGRRRDVHVPMMALTSSGGLWVEWRGTESRAVALEFKLDGSVNLAAFYPDLNQPLQTASLAANFSWKSASMNLRRSAALNWIFR